MVGVHGCTLLFVRKLLFLNVKLYYRPEALDLLLGLLHFPAEGPLRVRKQSTIFFMEKINRKYQLLIPTALLILFLGISVCSPILSC